MMSQQTYACNIVHKSHFNSDLVLQFFANHINVVKYKTQWLHYISELSNDAATSYTMFEMTPTTTLAVSLRTLTCFYNRFIY